MNAALEQGIRKFIGQVEGAGGVILNESASVDWVSWLTNIQSSVSITGTLITELLNETAIKNIVADRHGKVIFFVCDVSVQQQCE